MLEVLDSFFRYGAIAASLFAGALIYRDARCTISGALGITACFFVGLYLLVYTPGLGGIVGDAMVPMVLVCQFGPVAIWLFCLSLFDDAFELKLGHYLGGAAFYGSELLLFIAVYNSTGETPLVSPSTSYIYYGNAGVLAIVAGSLTQIMKIGIAAHLSFVAWTGRHDDLVEERRQFRTIFSLFIAGAFLWMVVFESWMLGGGTAESAKYFLMSQSSVVFAINWYMLWNLTRLNGEWLFGKPEEPFEPAPLRRTLVEDRHDLDILKQMSDHDALLEQGLSINRLAEAVSMPEHRLRRLINQHLGFRNFADYLNHHRIKAAQTRLAMIADRHVPVLTLAMDLGYGSLGPFNRAFKERAGMTPTEFRKKALADFSKV